MPHSNQAQSLVEGINFLAQNGLNLFAVFDCHKLPTEIQQQLTSEGIKLDDSPRLVLIGNSGGSIWDALQAASTDVTDPIDSFSRQKVSQFIHDYLDNASSQLLYPGPTNVSLIRLGTLAGWSYPSPLGLGIHPEYGLWFAYRALFATTADIGPTVLGCSALAEHGPCESCIEKPCISACPAGAVDFAQPFNIASCYDHRLALSSSCAAQCLSRLACPVGAEHRYSLQQIQYHYGHSLQSARKLRG